MRLIEDALERNLEIPERPSRVVSLVPSVTELLFDLGAGERIVGVSSYCTEPAGALDGIARVGGQKNPDLAAIVALTPDLVLAIKEENRARDVEALEALGVPVYVADVRSVEDGVALIGEVADLVDAEPAHTEEIQRAVHAGLEEARRLAAEHPPVRLFCPVWRDPWMTLSPDTFMFDLLRLCGADPMTPGRHRGRYPKVAFEEVRAARPELILLPDEPYAFGPADAAELSAIAPVALVEGKRLAWYGRRLAEAPRLAEILCLERKGAHRAT